MFVNHTCPHKQSTRDYIFSLATATQVARNTSRGGTAFTLPSTNFILEDKLVNELGFKIITAENNKEVYNEQLKKRKNEKQVTLNYGDALGVLSAIKEPLDLVWLDLCGPLSTKVVNGFLSFIQVGNFNNMAYVAITFASRREVQSKVLKEFYGMDLATFRTEGFPELVEAYGEMANRQVELIKQIDYKSSVHSKSMPMTMLTFKIKNK